MTTGHHTPPFTSTSAACLLRVICFYCWLRGFPSTTTCCAHCAGHPCRPRLRCRPLRHDSYSFEVACIFYCGAPTHPPYSVWLLSLESALSASRRPTHLPHENINSEQFGVLSLRLGYCKLSESPSRWKLTVQRRKSLT